jgi:hypothetical protein
MNTHSIQSVEKAATSKCESPIFIHRQPPAIPTSASIVNKQLPQIMKTSPTDKDNEFLSSTPPPPQPPQRHTNMRSLKYSNNQTALTALQSDNQTNTLNNQNKEQSNFQASLKLQSNNQLENAANEAVKLVSKTIMMGSMQNLNSPCNNNTNNQENDKTSNLAYLNLNRKLSV